MFCEEDFGVLFNIQSDEWLSRMRMAQGTATSLAHVKSWLANRITRQSINSFCLAIRSIDSSDLLGYLTLEHINDVVPSAEIGIVLGSNLRQGIGSEALLLLENLALSKFGYSLLFSRVLIENLGAKEFFMKNEYEFVEELNGTVLFRKALK